MSANLDGRVAVVMGATRGIGRAIVHQLATSGARVLFQGRDAAAAAEVIASAKDAGCMPRFVMADFAIHADIQRVMATAMEAWGRIDILVANGGDRTVAALEGPRAARDRRPRDARARWQAAEVEELTRAQKTTSTQHPKPGRHVDACIDCVYDCAEATSNRSRFMTLAHAATKSRTNFSFASALA